MKITRQHLKQIIKEELENVLMEYGEGDPVPMGSQSYNYPMGSFPEGTLEQDIAGWLTPYGASDIDPRLAPAPPSIEAEREAERQLQQDLALGVKSQMTPDLGYSPAWREARMEDIPDPPGPAEPQPHLIDLLQSELQDLGIMPRTFYRYGQPPKRRK
jgi:hypothetical protein